MQRDKLILVFIVSIALLFHSCKKNDSNNSGVSNITSIADTLHFTVDSTRINCNTELLAIVNGSHFLISGKAGAWAIELEMQEAPGFGYTTYTFEANKYRRATLWNTNPTGGSWFAGQGLFPPFIGSGFIALEEGPSDRLKGKFEFVTGNMGTSNNFKTVTGGRFNIKRR